MDRRKLGGAILGALVGVTLLGTGIVVVVNIISFRAAVVEAFGGPSPALLRALSQGSGAAVATPGAPVVADAGVRTQGFLKSLGDALVSALESSGKLVVKNTLGRLLGELAKGAANWIATGSPGQMPLFYTQAGYEFAAATRDAATAEFLDKMGQSYGVDVCNPDIGAKLVIHYSSARSTKLQSPRCSLKTIQDRWAQLLPDQDAFLREFTMALEPDQNDLGIAITMQRKLANVRETKENAAILERLESQGLKPLKDLAGNIITPASAVADQIRQTLSLGSQKELSFIGDPIADAIGIFTNTLGGRLQEKWLQKGFVNIADVYSRTGSSALFGGVGRYSIAEPRFAALAELELGTAGAVDVLSELTTCSDPDKPGYGGQCVLDASFSQAIQQRLTVREAMDRGLLRGEWAFGYQQDGSQPRYGTGYPYSSMVILRAKRVLPVGWEMAAQVARALGISVTLDHVVHCYEDSAAMDDPARPADCLVGDFNPFYHLVDPNWLLKVPATYCVRRGASSELLTEQYICNQDTNGDGTVDCVNLDSNVTVGGERSATLVDRDPSSKDDYYRLLQRAEYCADEQSCVAENPDGSCRAYGYCFEEKPTFSLGDASCPAQFASCIGVTTPGGQSVAYLEDTLQKCSAGAAGCQWYSRRKSGDGWSDAPADRVYLNGEAATCSSNDAGCRKLLRFGRDVNLVQNGGFERYDRHEGAAPGTPDNFFIATGSAQGQAFTGSGQVYEGVASFRLTANGNMSVFAETGSEVAGRTFVASVASRGCDGGTLSVLNGDGGTVGTPASIRLLDDDDNGDWHVTTVTGTTQAPGTSLTVQLENLVGDGNCYLDALALAEGDRPAALSYGSGSSVHMSSRATRCTQDDVGCQAFVPTSGDPTVFGRITANDYCPTQCVGYQNFSPLRTVFEEREGLAGPASSNFIPATARSCSAVDVGCSEFTSLAEVPEGGERVAYFSQVQQCVAEGAANVGTYYTWEGSDTAGYQLRVWQLLRTNLAPDLTPCTNLSLSESPVCEDVSASGLPHSQAICDPALGDPDCREVFDSDANSHFVLWSRVVQSTDDCRQYRRTGVAGSIYNVSPRLARRCPAAANGCRQYRGATGGNTRTALLADFETPTAAGWGGGRLALTTEALQVGGHSLMIQGSAGGTVTLRRTEPVQLRPGHQYMLTMWVKGSDRIPPTGSTSFRSGFGRLLSRLGATPASAQPSTVNLEFAGGAATVTGDWQMLRLGPVSTTTLADSMTFDVTLLLGPGMRSAFFDNVLLKEVTSDTFVVEDSWDTPQACDNPPGLPNGTDAEPRTEPGAMVGCAAYRVGSQQVTLRSFNRLCAERNVGCQAFMDTSNSSSPFAQRFNATCSLGGPVDSPATCSSGGYQRCVVGVGSASCRYTETANAGAEFLVTPSDPEDGVTVSADRVAYYVDSASTYCSPEVAGCTELGQPRIGKQAWTGTGVAPANGILGWQQALRVINPDQFSRTLCTSDQLWCASHRLAGGGSLVFKDPLGSIEAESRVCEYRTGVQVERPAGPQLVTGWFRTGTDEGCRGASDFTLPLRYSPSYSQFVGTCPTQYNGCTDYRNPRPSPTGGQLHNYFIRSSVDSSSCNGLVDVAGGCLLFLDPNQPPLYSTGYSYPPNRLPGQPPVATSTLDSNVVLKVRRDRTCSQWYTCGSSVAVPSSATGQRVCTSLTSCSQLDPATNQCANPGSGSFPTGSAVAGEFTFVGADPAESTRWKNLSGFTVPGIQLSSIGLISRGYAPLSSMPQLGLSAQVSNGDFEQSDSLDSLLDGTAWNGCDSGSLSVPAEQACSYVTAAGKVAEGRAALRLATTLAAAAEINHSPINLASDTEYSISVQLNTEDLASGEVLLEVLGSAGTPLITLRQVSGKGWQGHLDSFVASGSITLRLAASDDAVGSAYVDDVKIQPVLKVSGSSPVRLIGQQCRVYPRSDAPSCRYTQDDGEYRGITGYCLQPDPRDPSRCIQWWPVDVVAGQSLDVFGTTISLGSRVPLLYCTETTKNRIVSSGAYDERGDEASGRESALLEIPIEAQWHWSAIASIDVRKTRDDGGSPEYGGNFKFLGPVRNWSDVYLDDFYGFYSDEGSMQVVNNTVRDDGFVQGGEGHGIAVGVIVNPTTGMVTGVQTVSDTNDTCSADNCRVRWEIDFVLRNACQVMAEVVTPGSIDTAWYNRFTAGWSEGNVLGYSSGQYADSYGASNLRNGDLSTEPCNPIRDGDTGCKIDLGVYPPLSGGATYIHGGSPYAINPGSGEMNQLMCTTETTNLCTSQSEREACFAANGYCTGFSRPTSGEVIAGTYEDGAMRLSQLFARSNQTWTPDTSGGASWVAAGKYRRNDCSDAAVVARLAGDADGVDSVTGCWDRRTQLTTDADLPQVPQHTINGQATGELAGSIGGRVELKFTSHLSLERLPLRYIRVDWGVSPVEETARLSVNHQTSMLAPHVFEKIYSADDVAALLPCDDGNGRCAQVRVQVEDNWGYCNGSIATSYTLYDDSLRQDLAGCGSLDSRWTTIPVTIRFPSGGGGGGGSD